jgi:hypothetical protein
MSSPIFGVRADQVRKYANGGLVDVTSQHQLLVAPFTGPTAPPPPLAVGQLWIDNSADPTLTLKRWNGTAWEIIGGGAGAVLGVTGIDPVTVDNTDPQNPIVGVNDMRMAGAALDTGITSIEIIPTNTLTRGVGDFLADGFTPGRIITLSGFTIAGNNATKVIATVSATVITVTDATGLTNEIGFTVNKRIVALGSDRGTAPNPGATVHDPSYYLGDDAKYHPVIGSALNHLGFNAASTNLVDGVITTLTAAVNVDTATGTWLGADPAAIYFPVTGTYFVVISFLFDWPAPYPSSTVFLFSQAVKSGAAPYPAIYPSAINDFAPLAAFGRGSTQFTCGIFAATAGDSLTFRAMQKSSGLLGTVGIFTGLVLQIA